MKINNLFYKLSYLIVGLTIILGLFGIAMCIAGLVYGFGPGLFILGYVLQTIFATGLVLVTDGYATFISNVEEEKKKEEEERVKEEEKRRKKDKETEEKIANLERLLHKYEEKYGPIE